MPYLKSELNGRVLHLTIDRPKANAFNLELVAELQAAFKQATRDSQVKVVVLTAAGRVFGAGQDIEEIKAGGEDLSFREHLLRTYNPLVLQIRTIEKPVIAAVNGPCAGASLGIALACDIRIAADFARFVVGFSGIGLAPDSGVSLLLPALIGLGRALEFTFSNQPISAEKALAWGLVNRVIPADQLMEHVNAFAEELSHGAAGAFGLAKRAYNHAALPQLQDALDYESYIQEIAGKLPDHQEGISAFLEKRPAKFN